MLGIDLFELRQNLQTDHTLCKLFWEEILKLLVHVGKTHSSFQLEKKTLKISKVPTHPVSNGIKNDQD